MIKESGTNRAGGGDAAYEVVKLTALWMKHGQLTNYRRAGFL